MIFGYKIWLFVDVKNKNKIILILYWLLCIPWVRIKSDTSLFRQGYREEKLIYKKERDESFDQLPARKPYDFFTKKVKLYGDDAKWRRQNDKY